MITINKKYQYPSQWEELSPEQYLMLVLLLLEFMQGNISAQEVRLAYFLNVSNVNPSELPLLKQSWKLFRGKLYYVGGYQECY